MKEWLFEHHQSISNDYNLHRNGLTCLRWNRNHPCSTQPRSSRYHWIIVKQVDRKTELSFSCPIYCLRILIKVINLKPRKKLVKWHEFNEPDGDSSFSVMSTKSKISEPLTTTTLIFTEAKEDIATYKGFSTASCRTLCRVMSSNQKGLWDNFKLNCGYYRYQPAEHTTM